MDRVLDESTLMIRKIKRISRMQMKEFQALVWGYYKAHGRSFDWRQTSDPYHIVVSEVMLQQTQTSRVQNKYPPFVDRFYSFESLACAPLFEVLSLWQGLGYNRRGKYLHQIAKCIVADYNSQLPSDPEILVKLPGIGKATAASIVAFAFNKSTIFIETNIRSVFLHQFFSGQLEVHDKQIMPLIEQSLDTDNPREWYYALMDYGVALKKRITNPSRSSAHHTRQSTFQGSVRQVRGLIIRLLTQKGTILRTELPALTDKDPSVINAIISDLCKEGLITLNKDYLHISE